MEKKDFNFQNQERAIFLKETNHFEGVVYKDIILTNEDGVKDHWQEFVTFPPRLSEVFPGSKMTPEEFLRELGVEEIRVSSIAQSLLSDNLGSLAQPTFFHQDKDFQILILNGAVNIHALAMTQLAAQGFTAPENRALYQQHLYESIYPLLGNNLAQEVGAGFVFRDDCIASVISLAATIQKHLDTTAAEHIQKGVLVQIDGPVTAQGILLAKAYQNRFDFPLLLVGSYWAGGLTKGEVDERGVRKHANYITYCDQLLERFSNTNRQWLEDCRDKNSGVIQVVGDMGKAEEGIEAGVINNLRKYRGKNFCFWNDIRCDEHGSHPNCNKGLDHLFKKNNGPIRYYPARGAYMSLIFDLIANPNLPNEAQIKVEKASRLWTQELGYGAGFKKI